MTTKPNLSLIYRTKHRLRARWAREVVRFDSVVSEIMGPALARGRR